MSLSPLSLYAAFSYTSIVFFLVCVYSGAVYCAMETWKSNCMHKILCTVNAFCIVLVLLAFVTHYAVRLFKTTKLNKKSILSIYMIISRILEHFSSFFYSFPSISSIISQNPIYVWIFAYQMHCTSSKNDNKILILSWSKEDFRSVSITLRNYFICLSP